MSVIIELHMHDTLDGEHSSLKMMTKAKQAMTNPAMSNTPVVAILPVIFE